MLSKLLDTPDNSEVIRDAIASILKLEIANQVALATAAGVPTTPYDIRVFTERTNPWDEWNGQGVKDRRPIVNVWYDSGAYNMAHADYVHRQKNAARYNVDIVTLGESGETAEGHQKGDRDAAFLAHQTKRIIRSILMSSSNHRLNQPANTIWRRWVASETSFKPGQEDRNALKVHGFRIVFEVDFNEYAPQFEGCALEGFNVTLQRADTGEVLATLQRDTTTTEE